MTRRDRVRGERIYRILLRAYPRAFRERYARDMLDFYRARITDARPGVAGVARVWSQLLPDMFATAMAERLAWLHGNTDRATAIHRHYGTRREHPMSILEQDVRYAIRGMLRQPAFALIVLGTLALGIGANGAIFTIVNGVLLRPLPYANAGRIVDFAHKDPYSQVSEAEFVDYKKGLPALSRLAAYSRPTLTMTIGDESQVVEVARVSLDFFPALDVAPAIGRGFAPEEFSPTARGVVVLISHALWQQQFAGDVQVVGRTLLADGVSATIVGVMPQGFDFPNENTAFWFPWRLDVARLQTRNNHYLRMVGLLAPGASLAQLRAQANALDARWMQDFPDIYGRERLVAVIEPLREHLFGRTRPYLVALLGAAVFVLLIACVNVANLLLVRGDARRKELAIRTALGASAGRVVRQMLTESLVYAALGAIGGSLLAIAAGRLLVRFAPSDVPRLHDVGVDGRVVAFMLITTVMTALVFGLVPALRGIKGDSAETLRDGGRTSGAGASHLARRSLVMVEVALAVVLLSGAGVLMRSLIRLRAVDLGFAPEHIQTLEVTLPPRMYTDTTARMFFDELLLRVRQLPDVSSAALDGSLPISGDDSAWSIMIDGHVLKTIGESPSARPAQITSGYFKTMGISLRRGREFTEADGVGAPFVAVINERMANMLWPGVNPVGHTLKMFSATAPWVTIVGVAADVRARGIQNDIPPIMYFPYAQAGTSAYYQPKRMTLVMRTKAAGDGALVDAVRGLIRRTGPRVAVSQVATMDDVVGQSIASRRFTTGLVAAFAILALMLAAIGIYGVIAYGVSQRRYEIGVRVALGASPGSVIRLVLVDAGRTTLTGLAIGLCGAALMNQLLRSLLVQTSSTDAVTLASVALSIVVVAAAACLIPTRRAMMVSPTEALRAG